MRVISWNLFHGRSDPGSGRLLLPEFSERLAGWEWDVALLQEVPPWWPPELARATGARQRTALTSRNSFLPVRRWLAERFADIVRSEGGGSNAILVRGLRIDQHRIRQVNVVPERRVVHGVQLAGGAWVLNLHLTAHHPHQADAERVVARETALRWAGRSAPPIVIGGDFNRRKAEIPNFTHAAHNDVDHIFARGLAPAAPFEVLDRGTLSDHAPIRVELR
jgi:endonuclease/exonuclease/phosphatase family metal-dependent hydrolase